LKLLCVAVMVQSVTPEDDCKILDTHHKAKRFAYCKAAGNDPWAKFGGETNGRSSANTNKSFHSNDVYPKPSQFKGKSLSNYLETTKSINGNNSFTKNKQSKALNLDTVWSIRNNVPFNSQSRESPSALSVKPSCYSRYKFLNQGASGTALPQPVSNSGYHFNQASPWSTKQSQFSYSDSNNKFKTAENDDEFDHDIPLANALSNSFHKEPVGGRPMSARTEKARKMHDAYLKSTGMGKYAAPSSNSFSRHESKGLKRKPNLLDDTQ